MKIEPKQNPKRPKYAAVLAALAAAAMLTGCQNEKNVQIEGLTAVVGDTADFAAPAVSAD